MTFGSPLYLILTKDDFADEFRKEVIVYFSSRLPTYRCLHPDKSIITLGTLTGEKGRLS